MIKKRLKVTKETLRALATLHMVRGGAVPETAEAGCGTGGTCPVPTAVATDCNTLCPDVCPM